MAAVEFRDRAAYLPDADALVLADLHLGRDATSAVQLPLGERADLVRRLEALLGTFDPATVAFAGDVLHAFDHVPEEATGTLSTLRERVRESGARLAIVRGNHDALLDGDHDAEHRLSDGTVVLHGDELPSLAADRYVIGHDHPAIEIEGRRRACMLYGPDAYDGADVVVLPAFNRLAPGTAVNGQRARDFQSPLVARGASLDRYRPVVWDDDAGESLAFPSLGEFRGLL